LPRTEKKHSIELATIDASLSFSLFLSLFLVSLERHRLSFHLFWNRNDREKTAGTTTAPWERAMLARLRGSKAASPRAKKKEGKKQSRKQTSQPLDLNLFCSLPL